MSFQYKPYYRYQKDSAGIIIRCWAVLSAGDPGKLLWEQLTLW